MHSVKENVGGSWVLPPIVTFLLFLSHALIPLVTGSLFSGACCGSHLPSCPRESHLSLEHLSTAEWVPSQNYKWWSRTDKMSQERRLLTRYFITLKGHMKRLLILTMLLLQISVPLSRDLNIWLPPDLPCPLGWDSLSSGYRQPSHEPKVSGRPLGDSHLASEIRDVFMPSAARDFSLFSKGGWQIGLNSHAKPHQLVEASSQNVLNWNTCGHSVGISLKRWYRFPLRPAVSSRLWESSAENDSSAGILWARLSKGQGEGGGGCPEFARWDNSSHSGRQLCSRLECSAAAADILLHEPQFSFSLLTLFLPLAQRGGLIVPIAQQQLTLQPCRHCAGDLALAAL